jgi:hypothetical protein
MPELKPHVLIVTHTVYPPELPGEEEFVETEYALECPGVTDQCRAWLDCVEPGCAERRQVAADRGDDPVVVHGREHRFIDIGWAMKTDRCLYADSDHLSEVASALGLPAGRHLVDVDYRGDGEIDLIVLEPTR